MNEQRPDFIYPPGSVLMHSPLVLTQADMYGFFLKGKLANLQQSVDQTLNRVANNKMYFKVLSPYVLTTFTQIAKAYSSVEVDRNKGWIQETDIITWVMVGKQAGPDSGEISEILFQPLHIWVNDAMALINGRELFGYPKYACEYRMPGVDEPLTELSLSAKSFQKFSPDAELAMAPLLQVKCRPQQENALSPLEAIGQTWDFIQAQTDFIPDLDALGAEQVFELLFKPAVEQVFLKQFPDASGTKAVYQALLQAPARVNKVHHLSLLDNSLVATVFANDSFPLADTLGVQLGEQQVLLPYHVNFDFEVPPGEVLVDNSIVKKEKIAILGGGVAAITAAMCLTEQPGWQNRYQIDIYQQGWRIGGKGASGRNAAMGDRIEEHGLHIWFGFYQNAAALMRKAYEELGRADDAPLASFVEAFKPHNFIVLQEQIEGRSLSWPIEFPPMPGIPGDSTETLTLWKLVKAAFYWIRQWLKQMDEVDEAVAKDSPRDWFSRDWFERLNDRIEEALDDAKDSLETLGDKLECRFNQLIGQECDDHHHDTVEDDGLIESAVDILHRRLNRRFGDHLSGNDELRRLYIGADLGLTILKGMFVDGVFKGGFDVINGYDYREWLRRHGASERYTVDSAPVRGFYDLVFAYEQGDFSRPNVEAGTIIRSMLRIALCYQGGVMWKMQAGMGDTVFTPYYEVLKRRGVNFHFFHQVQQLHCQGQSVSSIEIVEQANLKPGLSEYQPLVDVKGLGCWPSEPLLSQLDETQARLIAENRVNLEHFWSDWPQLYQQETGHVLPVKQLRKGIDFDKVIFGLSIGAVPHVAKEVMTQSPALSQAVAKVQTVATQAYQLWLNTDLNGLGWQLFPASGEEPVLSAFSEPYDTWASMDQLIDKESWPIGSVKNASYFCSALPVAEYPPREQSDFNQQMNAVAKSGALGQLEHQIGNLWPEAKNGFVWDWLHDPEERQGQQRFDSQYWRANVDPSERYVLSVKDSSRFRITTDGTGLDNLYVTGDWIKTGLNVGCVEAATMAGMHTSKAICGYPRHIKGEEDF